MTRSETGSTMEGRERGKNVGVEHVTVSLGVQTNLPPSVVPGLTGVEAVEGVLTGFISVGFL